MTQTSRPAATDVTTWPNSDAGPYTADQWAELFQVLFTGDQQALQGPLIRYLNELQGSVNAPGAAPVLRVVTGAAMVNGHWFLSDANVDFTVTAPAVNPRIDVIVIAVNNTAVDFAVSDGGFTLDFPDALADYGGDADIEEYSCRLCIVQGAENAVPGVPGLDQNANHYMIPLYQYEIAVGGATSNETDRRDFCEFSTEVVTAMIAANAVTDTELRDSAGTSVIGKAGAGVGDPADIVAGVNDRVLSQAAGTLSFRQVSTDMIGTNAVTDTKLRNSAGFSIIGKADVGGGDPADIIAGVDTVLAKLGAGNVAFQLIVPALVTDRTRKFLVMPNSGASMSVKGQIMTDGGVRTAWGQFIVPNDFASGMTVTAAIHSDAIGNLYVSNTAEYGQCGEAHAAHTDTFALAAVGVTVVRNCIATLTLTNEAIGDLVSLTFVRDAADPLDTTNDLAELYGWIVEYTADS